MLNIYDTSLDFDFDKNSQYFREITFKLFNQNIDNPIIDKTNIDNPIIDITNIDNHNIDKSDIYKPANIYETYIDVKNIDKNYIDVKNIDKNIIDVKNIDKNIIDVKNIDKNIIDKNIIDVKNIDKNYIDKNYIDKNYINNKYYTKNINKYIIIDIKKSYIYNIWNDNLLKIIEHDIIISLFTIDEFKKYYIMDYEDNVIKSGKKFINFPLNKKSQCAHINVVKSICKNIQCGILAPFEDMKRIILIINKYIKNNNRILLHCNHDYQRLTVFLTCVMIVNNYEIDYILNFVNKYNIRELYKNYIIDFLKYLKN